LIAVAVIIGLLSFSGCAGAPHRADLEMFNLVVRGKATYKQRFLWLRRTSYGELVRRGTYYVLWCQAEVDEVRGVAECQSVKGVIAEVTGEAEGGPRRYYLARGIGVDERVFVGDVEEPEAAFLTVLPGDLLVIRAGSF
jgi:hypothetical protein